MYLLLGGAGGLERFSLVPMSRELAPVFTELDLFMGGFEPPLLTSE